MSAFSLNSLQQLSAFTKGASDLSCPATDKQTTEGIDHPLLCVSKRTFRANNIPQNTPCSSPWDLSISGADIEKLKFWDDKWRVSATDPSQSGNVPCKPCNSSTR
ncbi:hypothetical protein PG997_012165 [Apiospora hydei]|uniref:Uncharacterized protein n=1 Tax=Apiospora hydei TaxID=1337664 RepID=A0ABR1V605_9PEZI